MVGQVAKPHADVVRSDRQFVEARVRGTACLANAKQKTATGKQRLETLIAELFEHQVRARWRPPKVLPGSRLVKAFGF